MENKNSKTILAVIALIVGVLVGWFIWGSTKPQPQMMNTSNNSAHMMPDGTMMGTSNDMASMMASMNANLKGKTGDAFDQAFIEEMIMHHEGAVQMAELALTNAKHAEIKMLANNIITAQNGEIAQMKSWLKSWYNISQ